MADPSPLEPEAVLTSLTRVVAPSHGINIVDLGLVYGITCDHGDVLISMTLPSVDSPIREALFRSIRETVHRRHPDARVVEIELVWDPPWREDFITAEGELQRAAPIAVPDATDAGEIDDEAVWQSLDHVIDPELGISIVDLGLVYSVVARDRRVAITHTLTTPGCPLHASIQDAIQRVLETRHPAIEDIAIELVWDPPWDTDRISPKGRAHLGRWSATGF